MLTSRRAVAAATAIAVLPLTFLVGSAPASAASCAITPKSVTVFTKARGVTFDVPDASQWSIEISDLFLFAYDLGDSISSTAASLNPLLYTNGDAGAHDAVVTRNSDSDCVTSFYLRRGAALSLRVSHDETYRKFSGRLKRVNFGIDAGYRTMKNAKVAIQRQTADGWVTVKTVRTNSNGNYSAKVRAGRHNWRAKFSGTSTTGPRYSASKVN
jgi:hypothetical protein